MQKIMKMKSRFLMAVALLGTVQMASAADITGKITLTGTPPPEKELPLDPSCGKLHTEKPKTRFYVVDASGGLADTFVYIKDGLSGKTFPPSNEPVVLDQVGCEYVPYVFGLQTKQKLMVKNSDQLLHNIHVTPTAAGNKESNKAQMAGSKPFEYTFDTPEILLRFKCDVHPWMFAYAGLVDHPFFGVSGKDGTYKIANVPPGKYTIEAYHRKAGKVEKKDITVGSGGQKLDFSLAVAAQ